MIPIIEGLKKHMIWLLIFIILVITVITVYVNGKIDFISFEGIGGVATLITVIFLALTLNEMKEQREAIYKPDLILASSIHFYMYHEKNGDVLLPSLWYPETIDTSSEKYYNQALEDKPHRKIGFPLYNIGMGPAKNVKIKWEFNEEKIYEQFLEKTKDNPIFPKDSHIEIGKFPITEEYRTELTDTIDYIIPSQYNNIGTNQVKIPFVFQNTFSYVLPLFLRENLINNLPELRVKLLYKDINNKLHEKNYLLRFRIKGWSHNDENSFYFATNIDMFVDSKEIS